MAAKKSVKAASSSNGNGARRSLSIFSRKGHDAPSPVAVLASSTLEILPIPKSSVNTAEEKVEKRDTPRPNIRRTSVLKSPKGRRKVQAGQIAKSISTIEEEMATSPNEEILMSIGASSALAFTRPSSMYPTTTGAQDDSSVISLSRESSLKRKNSGGVQKRTSNSALAAKKKNRHSMPGLLDLSGFAGQPERPLSVSDPTPESSKTTRPKIQVIIPHGPPKKLPPPVSFAPLDGIVDMHITTTISRPSYHARSVSEVVKSSPPMTDDPTTNSVISSVVELDATGTQIALHRMQSVKKPSSSIMSRPPSIKRNVIPRTSGTLTEDLKHFLQVPNAQELGHDASSNDSTSDDEGSHCASRSQRSSITSFESQQEQQSNVPDVKTEPEPEAGPESNQHHRGSVQSASFEYDDIPEHLISAGRRPSLGDLIHLVRTPSTQQRRQYKHKRSLSSGDVLIPRTLPEAFDEDEEITVVRKRNSVTLSEAERTLEEQLSGLSPITEAIVETWLENEIGRKFSIKRKPTLPPKSDKRLSRASSTGTITSFAVVTPFISAEDELRALAANVKEQPLRNGSVRRANSVRSVLSLIAESEYSEIDDEDQLPISSGEAERVIYTILDHSHDLADFFSLSQTNIGFYRVAKRYEMELMWSILRNMSPAAWEYRRTCSSWYDEDDSAHPDSLDYDASRWYKDYIRDSDVLGNLKILIRERCQSILRPETVSALNAGHKPARASRVDDALWRIWTFCKIFGGEEALEQDLERQIDWFRGGVQAQQAAIAVLNNELDDEFDDVSELMLPSEHFGLGNNKGGLKAEELFDVTEMWNCIRTISQGIIGQTEQARQYGVFDDTEVRGGDIDGEEVMLEDWHNHLLTKGLEVAYEISKAATSLFAFSIARRNGWTKWTPPASDMRKGRFLLEAASQLYQEKVSAAIGSHSLEINDGESKIARRQRRESMAEELKLQKKNLEEQEALNKSTEPLNSAYGPEEKILVWTEEKMMSRANSVLDRLSTRSASSSAASTPALPQAEDFERHGFHLMEPTLSNQIRDSPIPSVTPVLSKAGVLPVPSILVHTPSRDSSGPPLPRKIPIPTPTDLPPLCHTPTPSLDSPSMPRTPPPHVSELSTVHKDSDDTITVVTYRQNQPVSGFSVPSSPSSAPMLPPRPASMIVLSPTNASTQHPFQQAMADADLQVSTISATLASERAVFRIVEMGFTVDEAKGALKITDMGDGIRVDRAVEFLLRQQD